MDHAFVFREAIVLLRSDAFRVNTLDRGMEPPEVVATINKRDLREQQNEEDDENY